MLVKEKIEQAIKILQELNIDMWITFVRKTSEIFDPALFFLSDNKWYTWETAFIITSKGRKVAIAGRFDAPMIEKMQLYDEIISYDQGISTDLIAVIQQEQPEKIAVNFSEDNIAADGLTHGMFIKLQKILKGTDYSQRLVSSSNLLAALRGRKSLTEVEYIKQAVDLSEKGHKHLANQIEIGMNELDLEKILLDWTKEQEVEVSYPPLIHVGPNTTLGHARGCADIVVERGQLINIDYGVFVKGYASDIQRVHYIPNKGEEEVPDPVKKAFNTVNRAITLSADKLKPGVKGWEVDIVARKYLEEQGYEEFKHALGHQIGRNVHDGGCLLGPKWERYGESPFYSVEKNQVYTLEPTLFVPKYGFCGIEEDVIVKDNACEFLSNRQLDINILNL